MYVSFYTHTHSRALYTVYSLDHPMTSSWQGRQAQRPCNTSPIVDMPITV